MIRGSSVISSARAGAAFACLPEIQNLDGHGSDHVDHARTFTQQNGQAKKLQPTLRCSPIHFQPPGFACKCRALRAFSLPDLEAVVRVPAFSSLPDRHDWLALYPYDMWVSQANWNPFLRPLRPRLDVSGNQPVMWQSRVSLPLRCAMIHCGCAGVSINCVFAGVAVFIRTDRMPVRQASQRESN